MQVSKGDAVTYVALVLSAGLQALEPLRKEASLPPDLHPILSSTVWSFLPLALLVLVGILWLIRHFQRAPTPASPPALTEIGNRSPARNISAVQLVPSGEKMALVVTPCRGGTTVGIFVDVSHWAPSLIPSDWSKPERFYLGDMKLRSANVRFSIIVMGRAADGIVGWLWKILKSDGTQSGTHPWFVQGRQRAVFIFLDPSGTEEKFPVLLMLPVGLLHEHPIVIDPSDLPQVDY